MILLAVQGRDLAHVHANMLIGKNTMVVDRKDMLHSGPDVHRDAEIVLVKRLTSKDTCEIMTAESNGMTVQTV